MTTLPMWEAFYVPHEGGDVWVIAAPQHRAAAVAGDAGPRRPVAS